MVIAIDGPAGSGKSTVGRKLSQRLGFLYIDTGAMYRALTLKVLEENVNVGNPQELFRVAASSNIELKDTDEGLRVFLDGKDVTSDIRKPEVSNKVFYIADEPEVRKIMVELQRSMGHKHDCVIEGRDITSLVFPDADFKFYLDADFNIRARRRYEEFFRKGSLMVPEEIRKDLEERDKKDLQRDFGGLKRVKDAVYIDTTNLSIEEVISRIYEVVKK